MHNLKLAAAALAVALAAPAAAVAGHVERPEVELALEWLRGQQEPDGSIAGNEQGSAWAAVAFARGGVDPGTVARPGGDSLEAYVVAHTRPVNPAQLGKSLLDLERQVLALVASGADPRTAAGFDTVQEIKATFDGSQLGDPFLLNDDIFGLQALVAAGVTVDDEVVVKTREFVMRNQQPSGAFSYAAITAGPEVLFTITFADVDMTGQAVVALVATRPTSADPAGEQAEARALLFLKLGQWLDGGCQWSVAQPVVNGAFSLLFNPVATLTNPAALFGSNTDSTSWVTMGVVGAGHDPDGPAWTAPSGLTLIDFILNMQLPSGQFLWIEGSEGGFPVSTTAYAVVALSGHSFVA